jgi:urocanate hydratase
LLRSEDPQEYQRLSMQAMAKHCQAMVGMQKKGSIVFDYGNNLRQMAYNAGYTGAKAANGEWIYPGFVPAYIRPLFCEGQGPIPLGSTLR